MQALDTDKGELVVQLTYKKRVVHFLDPDTLEIVDTKKMPQRIQEGWGLTTGLDRRTLVMSDGSGVLYHMTRDPKQDELVLVDEITVHDCFNRMSEVRGLNELEVIPRYVTHSKQRIRGSAPWSDEDDSEVDEFIWANVIGTWCIAVIHPRTGEVLAWVDLKGLDASFDAYNRVANGIAFRITDDSVWVTGKLWSKTYRISLKPNTSDFNANHHCKTPWSTVRSYYKEKQCTDS